MSKKMITDLAFLGGSKAFDETLHVGRPNIGKRADFLNRVNEMLDRLWFTNRGPYVRELEERLAHHLGVKHCIAMCNATIALEIVAKALGLKGEVIVPSFTFVATAHALQWQEITPVFCDVAPGSHHIDPQQIEKHITPKTTGIMGVHVWGAPCNIEAINDVAKKNNLKVLYDAAHAFDCSYQQQKIGRFGDAEVFSFHATKFLNSFEGGAVTTNDDELAEKIRLMQNFGFQSLDTVIYIGTNGKMSEVSAAMALTGLDSLSEFIGINHANYQTYKRELADIPGVNLYCYSEEESNNYQYIVLEIDETITNLTRDTLVQILHAENIRVRRYFFPACHRMEPYKSYFPHAGLLLPHTEQLVQRVMTLPTGTAVSEADIVKICQIIRFCIKNASLIQKQLP